jgi:Asp-tRNA(Asn)/Glu-tRNA(Gln) amidotransferase A subunit family amidase
MTPYHIDVKRCIRVLVRRVFPWLLVAGVLSACSPSWPGAARHRGEHAFIVYWPPPKNDHSLRLAVKDLIDMQGVVTTAGSEHLAKTRAPAARDAQCLELARERGVRIVGKTNLTEFAVTASGKNSYFGTPVNRRYCQAALIPGGSSSGSAVAVASGMADVAFGTDTGGSIRMPAACCGIYGLKTTYGLVPTKGVFPISPKHLDTVGPMAKDLPRLVIGMDLLQRDFAARYAAAVAAKPRASQIRIGRLYLNNTDPAIDQAIDRALTASGFKIRRLDSKFQAKWAQAEADGKTVALADAWLNDGKYLNEDGVASTTKMVISKGRMDYMMGYKDALKRQKAWQRNLSRELAKVDFIAVPTLQNLPPEFPFWGSTVGFEWLVFNSQNTVGVNFAGNPALAIPIPMPAQGKSHPVTSLQLVGQRLSEAQLLNAGRLLAAHPSTSHRSPAP